MKRKSPPYRKFSVPDGLPPALKPRSLSDSSLSFAVPPVPHALGSATAALELTLRLLGIGSGDEVITTAYTYTASASVICHVGATPVFVDVAPGSYLIDEEKLQSAITPRTKAIIPVDIAGVMCHYDQILTICREMAVQFSPSKNPLQQAMGRISIIADAGTFSWCYRNSKRSGQAADFSCFSFHAVKNLTSGEGGAVTWNSIPGISDEEIYRQYQLLLSSWAIQRCFCKTSGRILGI